MQKIENANTSYDVSSSNEVLKVSKMCNNRCNVIVGTSRNVVHNKWDFSKMSDHKSGVRSQDQKVREGEQI